MWKLACRGTWFCLLLVLLVFTSACSSQGKHADDDFLIGTTDPFTDPFFANAPEWDSSVLTQSEVLSRDVTTAPEEAMTWKEKSESAVIGAMMVGGGVAKLLFFPFLGL